MTKRILGLAVAAVVVLALAGVALASAAPSRPTFGVEAAGFGTAADPADPAKPGAATREALKACVKAEVDGGADRKAARNKCADQLGVKAGRAGKHGRPGPKGQRGSLGRAAHAELVVPKEGAPGQWETLVVDRGRVKAAAADSITVERPDGPTVTLKVVPATTVKGAATVAELAPGRTVAVRSVGGEARSVVARG